MQVQSCKAVVLALEVDHRPGRIAHKRGQRVVATAEPRLDHLGCQPEPMSHVEGNQGHIDPDLNQEMQSVGIGETVEFANRGDIARFGQGAAHDQYPPGLGENTRLLLLDQGQRVARWKHLRLR